MSGERVCSLCGRPIRRGEKYTNYFGLAHWKCYEEKQTKLFVNDLRGILKRIDDLEPLNDDIMLGDHEFIKTVLEQWLERIGFKVARERWASFTAIDNHIVSEIEHGYHVGFGPKYMRHDLIAYLHRGPRALVILIEVAKTSLQKDITKKLPQLKGVKHKLVVTDIGGSLDDNILLVKPSRFSELIKEIILEELRPFS